MRLELPDRPDGALPEQIEQLWEYIFKIAEQLNAEEDR